MEWTQFSVLGQEKINNDSILVNVTMSKQCTSMTVSLQMLAKPHHNGVRFACSTYFDHRNMIVKYKVNNNTPDYNHTWMSPKISVLCEFNLCSNFTIEIILNNFNLEFFILFSVLNLW